MTSDEDIVKAFMPCSGEHAESVLDHACTHLRHYGPKGWRCIDCFERYEVTPALQTDGSGGGS